MRLENYQISSTIGFLPEPDPLTALPSYNEYFRKLDALRLNTPRYFGTTAFRRIIDDFSLYYLTQVEKSTCGEFEEIREHLNVEPIARLVKLALGSLVQAYVLGSPHEAKVGNVCPRIPAGIAKPLALVSSILDVPPIIAYQDYSLANWERVDKNAPIELGNIMVLQYLLGGLDESWFILPHVEIEMRMGKVPAATLRGLRGVKHTDENAVGEYLITTKHGFDAMNATFLRIPEYCSSDIFFERVRPYIHGQKMNPALPNGVVYEGVWEEPQSFYGETGAQSSIIPLCAAALGIKYPNDGMSRYVRDLHPYMPKGHRKFIADVAFLEKIFSIRKFVLERCLTHPFLLDLYQMVLEGGRTFLEKHARFAIEYIHRHSAKSTAANPHNIGTGGSDFFTTLMRHAACWKCDVLPVDMS
ncbi:MAG: indoleamine 2,3-dioxygenase [Parcubacteria group bacterium Greene1014_15]|nr:MAG: indoleamine 2,3-dioxygenase [Parcubacteria group bacterium Greene1014_15]